MKDTGRVTQLLRPRLRALLFGRRLGRSQLRELRAMAQVDRAHLVMLSECGIIEPAIAARLLRAIEMLAKTGFAPLRDCEPSRGVYFLYEDHLVTQEGPTTGGVLQTARSRNDLQATVLRLRLRGPYRRLLRAALDLVDTLLRQAHRHRALMMPLHTHGQVAVPDTLGHYYAAAAQAIVRDVDALLAASTILQASPLGAGAIGGTELPIDTARTAALLGFDAGPLNAVDAIAGRDLILRVLAAVAIYGVTLSRVAMDLWLWSTAEFGFLQFPDDLVGVSSAMPQKRNPFVLEHILGRSADAFGALATSMLAMHAKPYTNSISAGTEAAAPLARGLRRGIDASIMLREMIDGAEPQPDAMRGAAQRGFADATAIANCLVRSGGYDFRRAHALVGRCIRESLASGIPWRERLASQLAAEDAAGVEPLSAGALPDDLDAIVRAREYGGGPGPAAFDRCADDVRQRVAAARLAVNHLDERWAAGRDALDAASREVQARGSALGGIVYFFCADPAVDPVASRVLGACLDLVPAVPTDLVVDGWPVLRHEAGEGRALWFVRTRQVVTDALEEYLPFVERHVPHACALGVVNWHEGAHAADRILTVHTNGDATAGVFAPADPRVTSALVTALDRARRLFGLDDWQVLVEGTHWSGSLHDRPPVALSRATASLLDIEIGSSRDSWHDPVACVAMAHALIHVFEDWRPRVRALLGIGGAHFEIVFRDATLGASDPPFAMTHVLPNWCLTAGGYGEPAALAKLQACVSSIRGGIDGILCHDSVKGPWRAQAQRLADDLHVPLWRHRAFRSQYLMPR